MMKIMVSTEKRRVSKIERYITVNGTRFEAWDLYDTLNELRRGDFIYLTMPEMIQLFKKLKVIESEGSKWSPATRGKNLERFWKELQPAFDALLK